MQSFDLFSIGHSNIPAERFVAMLRSAGVNAVADVRSTPASRRFPWFSSKNLARTLQGEGVLYVPFGETLGGRPRDPALYRDGIADYEEMARQPEFRAGLDRLLTVAKRQRVCLMCAEREPRSIVIAVCWYRVRSRTADAPSAISSKTVLLSRTRRRNSGYWRAAGATPVSL
jgi:uncharacterized protein (DUF488 family)